MLRLASPLVLSTLLLLSGPAAAQDGAAPPEQAAAATAPVTSAVPDGPAPTDGSSDPAAPLRADEVARVDGLSIPTGEFERYVGTVFARLPAGTLALHQMLVEAVVRQAADEQDVDVGPATIAAVRAELEQRARDATDGEAGLAESLGTDTDPAAIDAAVRLLALQRAVVAASQGLPDGAPVDDDALRAWLKDALASADFQRSELQDTTAGTWAHGSFSRQALGRRILDVLPEEERSGVLTELIGILLIRRKAEALGVPFTAEDGARELAERNALVAARDGGTGVSYADIVSQTQGLTLEELVATPRFQAEALLARMVSRAWDEDRLRDWFEQRKAFFQQRYGDDVTFEEARQGVMKDVRQRTYQQLFAESTILRRY